MPFTMLTGEMRKIYDYFNNVSIDKILYVVIQKKKTLSKL